MSQENPEVARRPLALAADSRRRLEEHLILRFPFIQVLVTRVWWNRSPRSRLRQAIVCRLVRSGFEAANRGDYEVTFASYDRDIELIPPTGLVGLGDEASCGVSGRLAWRLKLLPELGDHRLSDLRPTDVQDVVDRLNATGCDASTLRNAVMPLRALARRAVARGLLAVNPTAGLELPAVRGRGDRIADPAEASKLIAALPATDRALWATAFYAGLRLGELRALRWEDVDLAEGVIRVRRSWDPRESVIAPKTPAGERAVPIASGLRDFLVEHRMSEAVETSGFVFGRSPASPFSPSAVNQRADRVWKKAKLERITLHECRHSYASLMIAAGVNAKALSTYMGHASVTITFDRYGHLMPGNETEAATLLDDYLARAADEGEVATTVATSRVSA